MQLLQKSLGLFELLDFFILTDHFLPQLADFVTTCRSNNDAIGFRPHKFYFWLNSLAEDGLLTDLLNEFLVAHICLRPPDRHLVHVRVHYLEHSLAMVLRFRHFFRCLG